MALATAGAWAGTVTPASGGNAISADTAASPAGTGEWTSLSGPFYAETVNGDLNNGTVTLTLPEGFEFDTAAAVSVVLIDGDEKNSNANMNYAAVGGNVAPSAASGISVTRTSVTFNVLSKSRGNTLNTIEWRGLRVRPLAGTPLASGNITPSGTSGIASAANSLNFGTLNQVPGAMTRLLTVLPGQTFTAGSGISGTPTTQNAGTEFNLVRLVAADKFFNPVTSYNGAKTISYSGPSSGCSITPNYTTSVAFTNGFSTTTLATTLRRAETTTITASDGTTAGQPSSSLTVNAAPVSQLVVTLPGQTFAECSGNSGTPSSQTAGVSFNIPSITATDRFFNVITSYAGTRMLTYSGPAGPASYTTSVNFSAGRSTTTLATTISNAQTTTISVSDGTISGPASTSFVVNPPPVSGFNAFETSTAAGATTGIIKTKISATAFELDIVALTAAPNETVSTGFTGTVKVELVDSSGAGNCSNWTAFPQSWERTFTAADQGRHRISGIAENNAWRNARVRISFPATSPNVVSCSTDNFAIRPQQLSNVATTDQDWQTAGTNRALNNAALGGVVHKAGRPFTITATGRNSAGAVTAGYAGAPTAMISQCSSGTAACPLELGAIGTGTWISSSGTVTTNTATYSEAGAFSLVLQDREFADVDKNDSSTSSERYITSESVTVGRFVPDHFVVLPGAIVPRTDLPACFASSFTYMDEPFGINYTLEARNAAAALVRNYAGGLARFNAGNGSHLNVGAIDVASSTALVAPISSISRSNPGQVTTSMPHGLTTGGQVYLSGVIGMGEVNNNWYSVTVIDATRFTIGTNTTGFNPYVSGGNASRLSVIAGNGAWSNGNGDITLTVQLHRAGQPDGPFDNVRIGIAPKDADAVEVLASSLNLDADKNGSNERVALGTTRLRFGRIALQNAFGSELLNLPIPYRAQFWKGSFFVTNVDDSCTAIQSANNVLLNNPRGGITTGNMSSPANVQLHGPVVAGVGRLTLRKPVPAPARAGSIDVTLNLPAENLEYLQGRWGGAAFNQNPRARAAFGIYKSGPVIDQRERY